MKHLSKRALAVLLAVLVALSTMVLASVTASAGMPHFRARSTRGFIWHCPSSRE